MKKLNRLAAVFLAAAFAFAGALPAGAVVVTDAPTPDRVFYRETAGDTFSGEFGLDKEITNVEAGEDPAFTISFEKNTLKFDSLYTSTEQTVKMVCGEETVENKLGLAVYDPVDVAPAKDSVTLTVKNSRTLKPVSNAAYTLYKGTSAVKSGLTTDKAGQITVGSLEPGEYELRPVSTPKGYKAASGVKFSVTSLGISGGDKEIRTTEGKKIVAGENEVLIAGKFSPDVELIAGNDKQIDSVTVTYENYGAALGKKGESKTFEYVTLQAAQEELNHLKNGGGICGAVHISYKLAEKSGRSYTQYLTEKEPDPTPVPAPPVNQGGTANTVTKPTPTAVPTPKVTATPAPTATPKPTSTPKPTAVPSPTPIPDGQLTITCTSDKSGQAFSFEVSGTRAEGGKYNKDFKTGADGKIVTVIPAGKYTVTPKSVKGFEQPEPQTIELAGGGSAYLTFSFVANQRDLTLTVLDDDGQPVPGVTVGLFEPGEAPLPEVKKENESGSTDISETLAQIKNQKAADEKRAAPYTKVNALYVGKTGEDGAAVIQNVPVAEFVAVPIELPDGYSSEKIATEIPSGLGSKFTVGCKYVAVDLSVWSTATNSPVVGADLALLGKDNTELAEWKSGETAHRLIRVPQGEYALKITQDGQSDTVHFEVSKEKSLQETRLETYLPGAVSESDRQELSLKDLEHLIPFVAGGFVLLAGIVIGLIIYRDSRKRSGGHR
ncbi:SpaA isopeptide-forming pilin-related protein [Acutalibacter intestini]|uniref:SpaA isopeptide-forming pilin-related protein n=1 Tax=Acutalibacter intestini TaxID=3093659 RepID=UPI002AC962D0|nr:SpaA isopeptide-forming pilin-related protein [Acutalibacter sp. M00204]